MEKYKLTGMVIHYNRTEWFGIVAVGGNRAEFHTFHQKVDDLELGDVVDFDVTYRTPEYGEVSNVIIIRRNT